MPPKDKTDQTADPRVIEHYQGAVRAKTKGYAGNMIREAGDTFMFEGPLGSWMEKVEASDSAAAQDADEASKLIAENERIARENAAKELKLPQGKHSA